MKIYKDDYVHMTNAVIHLVYFNMTLNKEEEEEKNEETKKNKIKSKNNYLYLKKKKERTCLRKNKVNRHIHYHSRILRRR